MMNSRRMRAAALCRTIVLPSWIVVGLAYGWAVENAGAQIVDHSAPVVVAGPDAPPPIATGNAAVGSADAAITDRSEPVAATVATTTPDKADATVEATLADPAPALQPEAEPQQVPTTRTLNPEPRDASKTLDSVEILDECWVVSVCVDRYLWALYQRAPKEDTIKVPEQRKVTVRKKRKMVTVTRTFTRLVDEDFGWKDPKAAERAGISMMDYVIGGVTAGFRLKLFHMLHAAEEAGLSPGITSAFRDDYRQSIASGLAAASNRSYHGGSLRGGYGHGLAADVVSVNGTTRDERWAASERLWKWIDAHGKEFGIGRPYLDRDPAHMAPIDGKEYADHRRTGTRLAKLDSKKRNHGGAKHPRSARSSKVRTI